MSDEETVVKSEHLRRMKVLSEENNSLKTQLVQAQEDGQKAAVAAAGWKNAADELGSIAKERDEAVSERDKLKSSHAEDVAMMQAGISDPDAMSIVRQRHEEGTDFAAHLAALAKEPPPILKSFFTPGADVPPADPAAPAAPATPAAAAGEPPTQPKVLPGNQATTTPPPPTGEMSPDWIRENYAAQKEAIQDKVTL